jgi:hypothetical protein
MGCENRVVALVKEVKPMDGTAVRCEMDRCESPALYLFVAGGSISGYWAYCEEHARLRAHRENLELPGRMVAAAGSW